MEGRVSKGRGGNWKKVDRGGKESSKSAVEGERRGRGRGSQHRGRGKRGHYRGRGEGVRAAEFHHRGDGDDEENAPEEEEVAGMFSRRKLESNWDRYEDSEKVKCEDDTPTCRGTDFDVLLAAAGDSFSQFRFSEEKDWGLDPFAINEITASLLDLPALADLLQQLPLHQRLDLEPELFQQATVEGPPTFAPQQEVARVPAFKAPSAPLWSLSLESRAPAAKTPTAATGSEHHEEDDDGDGLLDQLLSLGQPVSAASEGPTVSGADQSVPVPLEACKDVKEVPMTKKEEEEERSAPPRKEVTEEELEDWLDSVIS